MSSALTTLTTLPHCKLFSIEDRDALCASCRCTAREMLLSNSHFTASQAVNCVRIRLERQ